MAKKLNGTSLLMNIDWRWVGKNNEKVDGGEL